MQQVFDWKLHPLTQGVPDIRQAGDKREFVSCKLIEEQIGTDEELSNQGYVLMLLRSGEQPEKA